MVAFLGFALTAVAIAMLLFVVAVFQAAAVEVRQRNRAALLEFQPKTQPETTDSDVELTRAA